MKILKREPNIYSQELQLWYYEFKEHSILWNSKINCIIFKKDRKTSVCWRMNCWSVYDTFKNINILKKLLFKSINRAISLWHPRRIYCTGGGVQRITTSNDRIKPEILSLPCRDSIHGSPSYSTFALPTSPLLLGILLVCYSSISGSWKPLHPKSLVVQLGYFHMD